ncbi:MAG: hypothetical protein PVF31_00660, partial [Desulfobacterales bacterium]
IHFIFSRLLIKASSECFHAKWVLSTGCDSMQGATASLIGILVQNVVILSLYFSPEPETTRGRLRVSRGKNSQAVSFLILATNENESPHSYTELFKLLSASNQPSVFDQNL